MFDTAEVRKQKEPKEKIKDIQQHQSTQHKAPKLWMDYEMNLLFQRIKLITTPYIHILTLNVFIYKCLILLIIVSHRIVFYHSQ